MNRTNRHEPGSLQRFTLSDGTIRGGLLEATGLLRDMAEAHALGILESYALGQAYLAAGLLTVTISGRDRLKVNVDCEGPLQGFTVEASGAGDVRGYLKTNGIAIDAPVESFDMAPYYGQGILTITKILEDAKTPYIGDSILAYSHLAKDLAHYFLTSEQLPTAFALSIHFDPQGIIDGAVGLMLQAMPGADPDILEAVNVRVDELSSLATMQASGESVTRYLSDQFAPFGLRYHEQTEVRFFCPCSKDRFSAVLQSMKASEKRDFVDKGPHPLVTVCHNCNSSYEFTKTELENLFGMNRN